MSQTGTVREFHADQGWGVIDAAGTPGGCWVHFSAIAEPGYRALAAGQAATFRAAPATQDGYAYVAVKVWTGDVEPPARLRLYAATALDAFVLDENDERVPVAL